MKKSFILLFVLAVCSIALAEEQNSRRTRQSRSLGTNDADNSITAEKKNAEEPKKEKPDNRNVVVNAWLVRVSADALYESGVKPLSDKDKENVSVVNLLWCLSDPNNGEIVVSATTRARAGEQAENTFSSEIYLSESTESYPHRGLGQMPGMAQPADMARTYRPYNERVNFSTYSDVLENKQVKVGWKFNSEFIYSMGKDECPPNKGSVVYGNITIVSAQKPVIVAQTQIGDDMFFLVLRAEIVD
jgi:hypothetical protein